MDTQEKLAIDKILRLVAEQKASDLHLMIGSHPVIRLNNKLVMLEEEKIITREFMNGFIQSVLDSEQLAVLEKNKEVVLAYQFQKQTRFRINVFYQKGQLAAYLRLIGNTILPLRSLGLPPILESMTELKKGLLIFSGSFGSGKTTTSASLLDHINRTRSAYILTVEKPIEYLFNNQKSIIEQREVGRDTISFEQALAYVTQEDVEIVFLSELSTPAVIRQVMNIATSGRLVITNLEADTIIKTLELIITSFPKDEQQQIREHLAANLAGIVCQRLVPRIGGGQVAVAEIMTSTPPIQALIKEGSLFQINNIILTSRAEGMVSLDWSLSELVKTNEVLLEDALQHASDPQQLRYMLRV
ncbi:MAG: PilT/PilU family type 4a pilus ATPase [Patescibacteria group bacterium]|jgi:twitching motility protein PilT